MQDIKLAINNYDIKVKDDEVAGEGEEQKVIQIMLAK